MQNAEDITDLIAAVGVPPEPEKEPYHNWRLDLKPKKGGAKKAGKSRGSRRQRSRVYRVGQAVKVATQYDGVVLAEITQIDGHVFVVRSQAGKTYRILVAEII